MAKLDSFLQAMFDRGARALVLASGNPVSLELGGERRPVSRSAPTTAQIEALVSELAGPGALDRLAAGGADALRVERPGLPPVSVRAERRGDRLEVRLTPAGAPDAGPAAAEEPAIHGLFRAMLQAGASDLHLCSGEKPMVRVDGSMRRLDGPSALNAEEVERLLRPIAPPSNWKEFEETGDTDFAYEIPGVARFRANLFRDRHGPGAVFRTIPTRILSAEELGLPPAVLDLCRLTKGLVLVTGPTGSGKSTTLAALIDHINSTRDEHIITIEDPIEFVHTNRRCLINQREVNRHTRSFKRALRAALREDPDIVLVGEMRDLETIAIALETAETGHLVFGTLHTTTAVSTVDRIIDQFPADQQAQVRVMLSESLKGVVSQTLCRQVGGGRVAALEILIGVPSVANLIREGKTFQIPSVMQTGRKYGMVTLNESLMALVKAGRITPEEAYTRAVDKIGLAAQLKAAGRPLAAAEPAPA